MVRWEEGLGRFGPAGPELSVNDVDYILNHERGSTLIVLGRKKADGTEALLGYIYAYREPWGPDEKVTPSHRTQPLTRVLGMGCLLLGQGCAAVPRNGGAAGCIRT